MINVAEASVSVLLVEDDPEDAALTQRLLHAAPIGRYEVDWRDDVASGLSALAESDYDVMLLDYRLAGESGLDLLRSARAQGAQSPAILLTGQVDPDLDLKAMQAGVVDFLEKDHLDSASLERSIRYAAGGGRADRERERLLEAEHRAREEAEAAHGRVARILATLESERALFREVLEQLPVGVVVAEFPSGRLIFGNDAIERMWRHPVTPSKSVRDYGEWEGFHPDGRRYEAADWPLARTLRTGKPVVEEEVIIRRGDGSAGKLRLHSAVVRGDDGKELAGVVTLEDMTERSNAVDAIRFQAHLLDAVEQSVIATDLDGTVLYWNRHAQRLYGWIAEDALGRNIGDLTSSDSTGAQHADVMTKLRLGEAWSGEVNVKTKEGMPFPAYVASSPMRDRVGKIAGVVSISFDITERRETDKALRQSEEFFRAAFLSSSVPSLLVSVDGVVMRSNHAFCGLLGYDDSTMVGLSVLDITHADDRAATSGAYEQMLSGRTDTMRMEKRYIRRDGGLIDTLVMIAAVRRGDGEPAYFTAQVFDISDRKRAELAVVEREQHLAKIVIVQQEVATVALEDAKIMDLIVDRATSMTGAEGAGLAMLEDGVLVYRAASGGVSPQVGHRLTLDSSLSGRCILERKPLRSDDSEADGRVNVALARAANARSLTCAPLFHDDRAVGVLTVYSSVPHAFKDGDLDTLQLIAGLAAAGLANAAAFAAKQALLVERTAALTILGEREALIRSLIENAADPLITLDEQGLVSYASQALERLLGRPADDFTGVSPTELCHPDDKAFVTETVQRMLATTQSNVSVEARLAHRDGSWRMLRFTGRNMLQDPAVRGIVVNLHDMTDEAVVAAQLRQAQKLEAVGQLAGGVAHDFNNLLTVISGHSEFLAQSLDPSDARYADVEEIRLAADRAAALTRQLLAFSRQQMLQPKVVDMNSIVSGMQPMLRRLIGEDITLVARASTEPATVLADPSQLEQVLMNLVINGRDAMPSGGTLTIEVQVTDLDDTYPIDHGGIVPGRYVMLAVTDTGFGMSKEVREQIFDPFFTTKEAGKGTGLGLSTVYGIVKQSNGYIWAYSEPGLWSAFKVYFPLTAEHTQRPVVAELPAVTGGAETILLVEDEDAVRSVGRRTLSQHGYRLLEARNGEHALEVAAAFGETIDLLVTDVVMPQMDGRTLADRLTERMPGLSVLFLTGYTNDEILRRSPFESEGRIRLLQKPFTTQGLAAAVREALDARAIPAV